MKIENVELSEPSQDDDWLHYFDLRWQILRAPWQQARGSECDKFDSVHSTCLVKHIMARDTKGQVIGVGRIHQLNSSDAQIRYMAVEKTCRRQGLATKILRQLESYAIQWRCSHIKLNARLDIYSFYTRFGYKVAGEGELLFNKIPHVKLSKTI